MTPLLLSGCLPGPGLLLQAGLLWCRHSGCTHFVSFWKPTIASVHWTCLLGLWWEGVVGMLGKRASLHQPGVWKEDLLERRVRGEVHFLGDDVNPWELASSSLTHWQLPDDILSCGILQLSTLPGPAAQMARHSHDAGSWGRGIVEASQGHAWVLGASSSATLTSPFPYSHPDNWELCLSPGPKLSTSCLFSNPG